MVDLLGQTSQSQDKSGLPYVQGQNTYKLSRSERQDYNDLLASKASSIPAHNSITSHFHKLYTFTHLTFMKYRHFT